MEQAVGAAVLEAAVDNLTDEPGQLVLFRRHRPRQGPQDPGHARRGPAVADAPMSPPLEVLLAVVPDVAKEPGRPVPQQAPEAIDLLERFDRLPGHGQEGRGHVHRIHPDLGLVIDVMERAVGGPRRGLHQVRQHARGAVPAERVTGFLGREQDAFAVGRRVGDAVIVGDHAQPAVLVGAEHRAVGQAEDHVAVAPLEKRLHGRALLPGLPLHGQHGHLDLVDQGRRARAGSARLRCGVQDIGAPRRQRAGSRSGGHELLEDLASAHGLSPSLSAFGLRPGDGILAQAGSPGNRRPGARTVAIAPVPC